MVEAQYKPANIQNKTVQKILDAALRVWTRAGYHGASLKEIADEAGVAKSLLHYHFASKEHLLIELQAEWCHKIARGVRARLAAGTPSLATALAGLDQVWLAMVATRTSFPFVFEVWREAERNPAIRRRMVEFDREIHALLVDGFTLTLGPLASRMIVPVERMASLLHAVLDGFALRLYVDTDIAAVHRTFEDWKLVLAAAVTASPPPEAS